MSRKYLVRFDAAISIFPCIMDSRSSIQNNNLFSETIERSFFFRYMEAAPQLFLQLYIAYKSDDVSEGNNLTINIFPINWSKRP